MVDVALHQHVETDHLGNTLVRCNRLTAFSDDDAKKLNEDFYAKGMQQKCTIYEKLKC